MASHFRRLTVYRLAASLADEVYGYVSRWPRFDQATCGKQVVRAMDSVGANFPESSGRWHPREKRQFLIVARGSLYETEHWLERAAVRGLAGPDAERLAELARILNGLITTATPK